LPAQDNAAAGEGQKARQTHSHGGDNGNHNTTCGSGPEQKEGQKEEVPSALFSAVGFSDVLNNFKTTRKCRRTLN